MERVKLTKAQAKTAIELLEEAASALWVGGYHKSVARAIDAFLDIVSPDSDAKIREQIDKLEGRTALSNPEMTNG